MPARFGIPASTGESASRRIRDPSATVGTLTTRASTARKVRIALWVFSMGMGDKGCLVR